MTLITPSVEFWTAEGFLGALFVNLLFAYISHDRMTYGLFLLVSVIGVGPIGVLAFPVLWVVLYGLRTVERFLN